MDFIGTIEGSEIQVELKYCERCGGLWLRPQRTFREKTFRAGPRLNVCRAWQQWRCGHEKCTNEHTSMEFYGASGTTTVGAVWRNGDGPVALPQAHGSTATAVRPGLGRGGEAAVAAGT